MELKDILLALFVITSIILFLGTMLNKNIVEQERKKNNQLNNKLSIENSAKNHLAQLCDEKDRMIAQLRCNINESNFLIKCNVDVDIETSKYIDSLIEKTETQTAIIADLRARLNHKKMPSKLSWETEDNFQIG